MASFSTQAGADVATASRSTLRREVALERRAQQLVGRLTVEDVSSRDLAMRLAEGLSSLLKAAVTIQVNADDVGRSAGSSRAGDAVGGRTGRRRVPLRVDRRVIGEICLRAHPDEPLTVSASRVCAHVAPLLALALDRARRLEVADTQLAAWSSALAEICHDIQNPVSFIRMRSEMLRHEVQDGWNESAEAVLEHGLGQIECACRRVLHLCGDATDAARMRAGQPLQVRRESMDLVSLARDSVAEHQTITRRHRVLLVSPPGPIVGRWDRARLERVLSNLLHNAMKYSTGGDISVSVRRESGPDGDWAIVAVRDQGIGVPADEVMRIFQPFQRGAHTDDAPSGSGIGLASARSLVEALGGNISVQSEERVGSTFSVRLPMDEGIIVPAPSLGIAS
jgi:signal transduction histidine kinase